MPERPNIVGLPKPKADDLSAAVDEFERKLPEMIRHHRLVAKLQRAAYENYLEASFTPKQALELIKGIR